MLILTLLNPDFGILKQKKVSICHASRLVLRTKIFLNDDRRLSLQTVSGNVFIFTLFSKAAPRNLDIHCLKGLNHEQIRRDVTSQFNLLKDVKLIINVKIFIH